MLRLFGSLPRSPLVEAGERRLGLDSILLSRPMLRRRVQRPPQSFVPSSLGFFIAIGFFIAKRRPGIVGLLHRTFRQT